MLCYQIKKIKQKRNIQETFCYCYWTFSFETYNIMFFFFYELMMYLVIQILLYNP